MLREKRVVDAGADQVHARLQVVQILVQPPRHDVVGLRIGQLGTHFAEHVLDRRAEHAGRRPRNGVRRLARLHQAPLNGARELAVEEQELDDPPGEIRPCRLRYISNALAERSTAAHWMSS